MTRGLLCMLGLLLAAGCLTGSLAGCSGLPTNRWLQPPSGEPTPTPIPTAVVPSSPTYEVRRGEVVKELQFTGRVAPIAEEELAFQTNGRVQRVLIDRDEAVKTGQLLAELEVDGLQRDLTSAKLQLARAQAKVDAARKDLDQQVKSAQLYLEIARINLDAAKASDPTPRKTLAEVDLEKAKLALQRAQADFDAIAWRNDRGASAQAAALQSATLEYQRAQANYDLAMQAIASQRYQTQLLERQVALAQLALDNLGAGADPLLANDVALATLQVAKLEAAVADAQIVAPFDGRVLSVSVLEGRAAAAYQPAIVLGDTSTLEIKADLSSQDQSLLAVGMRVIITPVSRPGEQMQGVIRRLPYISGQGSGSGGTEDADRSTRVSIGESSKASSQGLSDLMRVTALLQRKSDVLWLPPQAIRTFEGRRFVVVQEGDAQRRVDVKIGIEGTDRLEILDGLSEGQTVIGQ
jgi:multidrug efflux pump subunit AcrA (membrane-fusion protein)